MVLSGWQYNVWNLFRTGLQELREVTRPIHPLFRCLLTVGVIVVVVVLIGLSTASRQPYAGTNNASWHTAKASRMNPASRKTDCELRVPRRDSDSELRPRSDRESSFFASKPRLAKAFFVFDVDRFRSPPSLS